MMVSLPPDQFTGGVEGIFHGLPAETYHAAPGVSQSMLKHMRPTPAHLVGYLQGKRKSTPAQVFGTLVHHKVLEPDKPLPHIVVKPEGMKFTTKEGKAWRDEHEGQIILTEAEHEALTGCVESIARHPACREIFAQGQSELSVFKSFALGGRVLRKARLDWVPKGNSLVDVKTTEDASPEGFAREIEMWAYNRQAAYYLDIWNDAQATQEKECFLFIAVEKTPPYLAVVYNLDPKAIGEGRRQNIDDLARYIECAAQGVFPGYPEEIIPIDLPVRAYRRLAASMSPLI